MINLQDSLDKSLAGCPIEGKQVRDGVHSYPISEEVHRAEILKKLHAGERASQLAPEGKRLHIGVAGFFNFEIAAITRPNAMVLLDINPVQQDFWKFVVKQLAANPNHEGFLKAMDELANRAIKNGRPPIYGPDKMIDYLREAPWVINEESYHHFHMLARNHAIVAATLDLVGDGKRAAVVGEWIKQQGLVAETCYWSNIGQYCQPCNKDLQRSSRDDSVFGDPYILYLRQDNHYAKPDDYPHSLKMWNGEEVLPEHTDAQGDKRPARLLHPQEFPVYEQLLRNVSQVSGGNGLQFMTHNSNKIDNTTPALLMFDGAPRNLARILQKRHIESQRLSQIT